MIEVYCGDGKGKTTAAVGLSIRAAGHHIPVLFVQFIKDGSSGEISVLKRIPEIEVMVPRVFYGFTKTMTEEQIAETRDVYQGMWEQIEAFGRKKGKKIIVLDEVTHACNSGMLDKNKVLSLLQEISEETEVLLTGRSPCAEFLDAADYVSEIQKRRHPYDRGIMARIGIEK